MGRLIRIGIPTGRGGGELAALCDHCLRTPSDLTPRIQEGRITIGHIIFQEVEQEMFG